VLSLHLVLKAVLDGQIMSVFGGISLVLFISCMPVRVAANRTLSRKFGPEREKVARKCSKLHNVELHNLYSSLNIGRVIKSRYNTHKEKRSA
jgi:hypothetical protein